jgi:serine protease AprX
VRKIVVGASIALMVSLVSSASSVLGGGPPPPAPEAVPIKADLDGDKVFDDLEARLAGMADGASLSVIVALELPATSGRLQGLANAVGAFGLTHRFEIVQGFAATVTKAQALALARLPLVSHVEENSVVRTLNDTAQASFGVTKARVDAGVDGDGDGNAATYSKDDLVAAVIDTGIDAAHQDLDEAKVLAFAKCIGGCVLTAPFDDNGHGTHVAATIAGEGDARADRLYKGAAPAGALVGVKVLNNLGNGSMADVTAGIDWVVANKATYGIEAINLSLGTTGCSNGTDSTSLAVNNAHNQGIVVGVAAGNSGPGPCTIGSPGAAANALTVGAMADMGVEPPVPPAVHGFPGFKQAYFSSRGKTFDGRLKPDVSAPGVQITSADAGTPNGYIVFSGTSMATPFTVGVALLMRDANPALTPQQVKTTITGTAVDWARGGDNKTAGTTGQDIDYGWGRLDGYAAIEAAKGADIGSPPAVPTHVLREGSLSGTGATVDYPLSVTSTQFPIAATLIMSSLNVGAAASPDFDLYLLNPSGSQVASAETNRRQDELGYQPTVAGTYTLRIRSFAGNGPYFIDISAGLGTDATPPTVTAVTPSEGATGVATNTNVTVTFSEPMDQASVQSAFSLVKAGGASVAGTFSWSGSTVTFDPTANLDAASQYNATVTTAAKDVAGNALAAAKSWSFTTSAGGASGTAFPTSTRIVRGTLRGGNAANLGADDNVYYEVNSNNNATRLAAWYGTLTGIPNAIDTLKVSYTGMNSLACKQTVSIKRWTTNSWVVLDTRTVGPAEVSISNLSPIGTLADYVSGTAGNGDVQIKINCKTSTGTFYSSGDLMRVDYTTP